MLTAKNSTEDIVKGFDCGANDYLSKPFASKELLTRMNTQLELKKINISMSKFVPYEFLQILEKESILDVRLSDQTQAEMAIMFSDMRSYTTLAETMTPEENFNFINSYLSRVGPVIRDHSGFVNQYYGDGILALFPRNADDALQAALAMHKRVAQYNVSRVQKDRIPIHIGVGIHSGSLMLGIIGESRRMEGSVVSDAVNLTARIEELTKVYGASILMSMDTMIRLKNPDQYNFRMLDAVHVKGRKEPVFVIEVFPEQEDNHLTLLKLETRETFERALNDIHASRYKEAADGFQEVLARNPEDTAAKLYLERCRQS